MSTNIELLMSYVNLYNSPGGGVFKKIKREYPDICKMIEDTQLGRCWTEKLYRYTHPDCTNKCKMCTGTLPFKNWGVGYQTYCSQQCQHSDPEFKQKIKDTFVQNYGTDNPFKNATVREKQKQTCQNRYGCDNPAQNTEVQARMKATNLERYGVENIFDREYHLYDQMRAKAKATCLDRLGVENSFSSPEIIEKRRQTWLQKYGESHPHKCQEVRDKYNDTVHQNWGTAHPMQNAAVLDKNVKNAKKSKRFVYPSGKEIMVQGYEPQALTILLEEGIHEDRIQNLRVDMPVIWYINDNGKRSRYYPDLYIQDMNLLVEVKSVYTSQLRPDIIALKIQAAEAAGYQVRLMIL
jgi:hypothetical protein